MRAGLRVLRWAGIGALIAVLLAGVALAAGYAYLQTEAGRAWAAEQLNRRLAFADGTRIRIGRLDGQLPGNLELEDVRVDDRAGTWLTLASARARWHPRALLAGRIDIENLSAEGLRVLRTPRGAPREGGFEWPEPPVRLRIGRFVLADAVLEPPVLGEAVAFRASGATAIEGPDEIRTRLDIERTDGVSGRAEGEALVRPRSGLVRFVAALNESGGGVLARMLALEGLPAVAVRVDAEGPPSAVGGSVQARAGDLTRVEARFTVDATGAGSLRADGTADVTGLVAPPLADVLSGELAFELHASRTGGGLRVQTSRFANDRLAVTLAGTLSGYAVDAEVGVSAADLRPFAGMAGIPLEGGATLRSRVRSDDFRERLTARVDATLAGPFAASSPLGALAGPEVGVEGGVVLEAGQRIVVRDLSVTTAAGTVTGDGTLGLESRRVEAAFRASVPRLAALADVAGRPLTGSLDVEGDLDGPLADPALRLRLTSPGLSVDGFPVGAAAGAMAVPRLAHALAGDAELRVHLPPVGDVTASGGFALVGGGTLRLDALTVAAREARVAGTLAVALDEGAVSGRLAGEAITLAPWSDLAGRELGGVARVEVELAGGADGPRLDARVDAKDLALGPGASVRIGSARGTARIRSPFAAPRGELRIDVANGAIADLWVTSAGLDVGIEAPGRASARLRALGDLRGSFQVEAAGELAIEDAGFAVTVTELQGSHGAQTLRLLAPAVLAHRAGTTSLADATFAVADGRLALAGSVGETDLQGRVELDGISLERLGTTVSMPDLVGTLSGHLRASGPRAAPTGELRLTATGVRSAHTDLDTVPPASGTLDGDWREGRLRLDAQLVGFGENRVEARASLPLQLDPATLAPAVPEGGAVDGALRWAGDLGPVWDMLSPYEDRFSGPGELALDLAGSVGEPRVSGRFEVTGGRYENVLSGTTLEGVNLRIAGDGDKLRLERLEAGDGKRGTLTGDGTILLRPAEQYPTNVAVAFEELLLVARDDLILVADGDLTLEGTFTNVVLSGRIVTGSSELSLAGTLPPNVVELEVREVNAADAPRMREDPTLETGEPSVVILDIDLVVPGRAFVRGLGLDSEWQGEVTISGDAAAPNVSGTLSPVRGHFALLGKRFDLDKGAIRFTGSDDVDPLLDLTAERQATNLTAFVHVTGTASNPKVQLTSRPPMPESEIASQVLFGTDSQSLSPAQSLQLASAVATYSGKGGAVGILDATRRALGVDAINFAESKEDPEKTRVSVGKYVTEGVYIELERGTEEDSRTATTVEVEVLPDVRLEGGTTEQGGNKVGVKWKWDY